MPLAWSAARSRNDATLPAAPDRGAMPSGESRLAARFGRDLLEAGYTVTPNLLLRYATQLQISAGELLLIQYILQHWWGDQKPHPSVPALAREMGKSERMVRYYLQGLRDKGFLRLEERHGRVGERVSNSFDFTPLFHAVCRIAELERACSALQAPPAADCAMPLQFIAADQDPDRSEIKQDIRIDRRLFDTQTAGTRLSPEVPVVRDIAEPVLGKQSDALLEVLSHISEEFGDEAHPRVSARRAENLRKRASLSVETFLEAVEDARAITLAHRSAIVRRQRGTNAVPGRKNLMPYFFATLESLFESQTEEEDQGISPSLCSGTARTAPAEVAPDSSAGVGTDAEMQIDVPAQQPSVTELGGAHSLWQAALAELQETIAPEAFRRWLAPATFVRGDDRTLQIAARDTMQQHWLAERLRARIEEALRIVSGSEVCLQVIVAI